MIKYGIFVFLIYLVSALQCPQKVESQLQLVTLEPQCFRKVYDSQQHDGHLLSRILNQRIANYKRILQDIKMNDVDHLKTHPVIKWAQSQSQIYLNLRLSHRHDSPTCSDIRLEQIQSDVQQTQGDFTIGKLQKDLQKNNSKLVFLSQCFFTHQKLLFSLNIDFNSTLSKLTVKKQGFGRYTVVGQKQTRQIWINPFTDWAQAGIWTQLRYKYQLDMDKYFQMVEQMNQNRPSKTKRKFRNKKEQKQFQTAQL